MQVKNRYFGTAERKGLYENKNTPGPQAYKIPTTMGEGPKISIKTQKPKN